MHTFPILVNFHHSTANHAKKFYPMSLDLFAHLGPGPSLIMNAPIAKMMVVQVTANNDFGLGNPDVR